MTLKYYLTTIFLLLLVALESKTNLITETKSVIARTGRQIGGSTSGEYSFAFRGNRYYLDLNRNIFDESWDACDIRNGVFLDENDPEELNALADYVISLYPEFPDICDKYWIGSSSHKHDKGAIGALVAFVEIIMEILPNSSRETKYYVTTSSKIEKFCSVCVIS